MVRTKGGYGDLKWHIRHDHIVVEIRCFDSVCNISKLDFLTDTYTQWLLQENIYERICASDLRYGSYDLSDEQNQWLETFIEIWDIIAEVD